MEKNMKKNNWVTLLYTWNTVNQLYINFLKIKNKINKNKK